MTKILALGAAMAALVLAGCSTAPLESSTTNAETPEWAQGKEPWRDPSNPIQQNRSIYFAYNSYTVEADGVAVCKIHSDFLKQHRGVQIVVQGHADERGGREYNLALGQRRAEAVKRELTMQGVARDQVETVSYGKERPRALGHDEESWAQNRRVDFVYPGERQ